MHWCACSRMKADANIFCFFFFFVKNLLWFRCAVQITDCNCLSQHYSDFASTRERNIYSTDKASSSIQPWINTLSHGREYPSAIVSYLQFDFWLWTSTFIRISPLSALSTTRHLNNDRVVFCWGYLESRQFTAQFNSYFCFSSVSLQEERDVNFNTKLTMDHLVIDDELRTVLWR